MASTYVRGKKIWIRYKADGKWRDKATGYRVGNRTEERKAEKLAAAQTRIELRDKPSPEATGWQWVPGWLELHYGPGNSLVTAASRWRNLSKWLKECDLPGPRNISRELCLDYVTRRAADGCKKSTARKELLLLKLVLDESVRRGHIDRNPAEKLGIKVGPTEHKVPWNDEQIRTVASALNKDHFGGWMHCTFLLGLYQASRMRQCALPLECVDLTSNVIVYPAEIVKGRKPFSQPIDPRLQPTLAKIVEKRRSEGYGTLCDIPAFPSIAWRKFLDGFGYKDLSHHGLRATWATRACLSGVPLAWAMKFCNHASQVVHDAYQRLSVGDLAQVPAMVKLPE